MDALVELQHYEVIALSWMIAATVWVVVSAIAFPLAFLLVPEEHAVPVAAGAKPVAEPARTHEPVRAGVPVGAV